MMVLLLLTTKEERGKKLEEEAFEREMFIKTILLPILYPSISISLLKDANLIHFVNTKQVTTTFVPYSFQLLMLFVCFVCPSSKRKVVNVIIMIEQLCYIIEDFDEVKTRLTF